MLEIAIKGSRRYWGWIGFLLLIIGIGCFCYSRQLMYGLTLTGLSRSVPWGLFTSQMNFLVGVAAGGIMLVLPYYLHNYKAFGRITILGEFLAVPALFMCLIFLLVHLGKPERLMNVFLNPTPWALVFWDGTVIMVYMVLNLIIGLTILQAERKLMPPPIWVKPLIYISIPVAFAIHTVTAFLYCGLAGRGFWLTAVLAPRFLASAFAAGPALLILIALLLRKVAHFDPGERAIQSVATIVTYALIANLFFLMCEVFVVFYSGIPSHMDHFIYLFKGLDGHTGMVSWMWTSVVLMVLGLVFLMVPRLRQQERLLVVACLSVFIGIWMDKGMGFLMGGLNPNPFHRIVDYFPTLHEILVTLGVYGIGALVLTVLYKIALGVRSEME